MTLLIQKKSLIIAIAIVIISLLFSNDFFIKNCNSMPYNLTDASYSNLCNGWQFAFILMPGLFVSLIIFYTFSFSQNLINFLFVPLTLGLDILLYWGLIIIFYKITKKNKLSKQIAKITL